MPYVENPNVMDEVDAVLEAGLESGCGEYRDLTNEALYEKVYPPDGRSKPGEIPHKETGRLGAEIAVEPSPGGRLSRLVTSRTPYAKWLIASGREYLWRVLKRSRAEVMRSFAIGAKAADAQQSGGL